MSVAFWSAKLSGGKPVEVQPPEGYVLNVQQAAITGEGHAVIKVKTVSVEGDNLEAVIATLRAKTTDQVNLSLVFGYDVPVSFVAEGKADVYLSGYYQPGPEEEGDDEDSENDYDNYDSEEDDDEEGSEDDDEEANIRNAEAAIAKLGAARKAIKNAPTEDSEDDSEDDEEDEDSEDDSEEEKIDSAFVAKMVAKHGLAGKAPKSSRVEELPSDDESEGDEESEEESEEEEAPPVKVQKTPAKGVVTPSGQKPKPTTPAHNNNNNKPKTPNGGNNNNNKTPNNNQGNKNNNNSAHKSGDKRKR